MKKISRKEPVHLRERLLENGSKSLYLDIIRNGKHPREYLKLYLIPSKNAVDREQNRQTSYKFPWFKTELGSIVYI